MKLSSTKISQTCQSEQGWNKDLCVLREKWDTDIPTSSFPNKDNISTISGYFNGLNFNTNVRQDIKKGKYSDCHFYERKKKKEVPSSCYGKNYEENWDGLKWFLYEHRDELMYTFDYILWDSELPTRKENQFWYLILYLKTLVSLIENPVDIVDIVSYQLVNKVADLVKRVYRLENNREPLVVTKKPLAYVTAISVIDKAVLNSSNVPTDNIVVEKNFNIKSKYYLLCIY